MKYALIENNQVTKTRLPKVGTLKDGGTVSNYHLLPHETLLAEGWLPLVDEPPVTDEKHRAVITGYEKHRAVITGYEIFADRVETVYSIEEIIPPAVSERELQDKARLKAQQLAVKSLIQADSISSNEMLEVAPLFPAYEVGKAYSIGDVFTYKRSLYEVIQAHTSQADWLPDSTPSLYKNHTPKGEIEDWRQPLGAHDAYRAGDVVTYNGNTYTSLIDNNVWIPDQYGWELYVENPPEYPEWVQPTGAHDDYDIGAIVTHNEQTWISIVANNVWEPGVYGWEVYTG
jgi:hypothetical protein